MRSAMSLCVLAASVSIAPGCLGATGPGLPPAVGATHHHNDEQTTGAEPVVAVEDPADPLPVGSIVWSNYHGTGLFFHGVVAERRDDTHRIVYANGASEWVGASALFPDSLGAEARIAVRPSFDGEFAAAQIGRRLGNAIYVRHGSGDEGWTATPQVRYSNADSGVPARGESPVEAPDGELGSVRMVDYRAQGLRFAAIVTAEREDGALHVVFLDGESSWVDRALTIAETLTVGDVVHVRRSWDPPVWVRGRIAERIEFAFRVELDDGGVAWTSLFRIRTPTEFTARTEPPPSQLTETQ